MHELRLHELWFALQYVRIMIPTNYNSHELRFALQYVRIMIRTNYNLYELLFLPFVLSTMHLSPRMTLSVLELKDNNDEYYLA